MTLTASPPRYGSWAAMLAPIKLGERGWRAFAVQSMVGVSTDGVWGPLTDTAVKQWQREHGLAVDGVVGPATQGKMLQGAGTRADRNHGLPDGVGYGFAVGEGAGVLAATNWSVSGGVDCGPAQWRIPGPPFSMASLKFAFNPRAALDGACRRLRDAQTDFLSRNRNWTDPQEALDVAVLQHNWPAGADRIVRTYPGGGKWWRYVSSPDAPATWVQGFTRAEWAKHYPSTILQFVA